MPNLTRGSMHKHNNTNTQYNIKCRFLFLKTVYVPSIFFHYFPEVFTLYSITQYIHTTL